MDRKGQSISINVIIVAVIALIVLVVLVAIFTGRIGIFEKGINKAGQTELAAMKISYGECAPGSAAEERFSSDYNRATTPEERQTAKNAFESEISNCKQFTDKTNCDSSGCAW